MDSDEKKMDVMKSSNFVRKRRDTQMQLSRFATEPTENGLLILGAGYGKAVVTGKVRSLVASNALKVTANNATFGDSWNGTLKSLVIVYRYGNTPNYSQVAFVKEGGQISISTDSKWARHDVAQKDGELSIIGAVYGLGDETEKSRSLIESNSFVQTADNATFTDTWKGTVKSLVVVYAYDSVAYTNIVTEGVQMRIIDSPPLSILGATYGPKDVTDTSELRAFANIRNARIPATNSVFGDTWPEVVKSLAVVYRYDGYMPSTQIVKEGDTMFISFVNQIPDRSTKNDNHQLCICGAAYGLADVTAKANSLITDNGLNVDANNTVWGDSWKGVVKSLTMVYRYGYVPCTTVATKEGSSISIQSTLPQTTLTFLNTNGLFHSNDEITVQTFGGLKWAAGDHNNLVLSPDGITFVLTVRDSDNAIQLRDKANNYVLFRDMNNGMLSLDTTGQQANGTNDYFFTKMDKSGRLRFAIAPNFVVNVTQDKATSVWSVNAVDTEQNVSVSSLSLFDIAMVATPTTDDMHKHARVLKTMEIDPCALPWTSFIWQLTGGFISALGLIPFINSETVAPGIMAVLRENAVVSQYMDDLLLLVSRSSRMKVFGATSTTGFLTLCYEEGVLWTVIKMILKTAGWYTLAWVLGKLIQTVFLPETEGAELLAQFVVWSLQTVESGLDLQACITSH